MNKYFLIFIFSILSSLSLHATNYKMLSDYGTSAKMISIGNIQGFDTTAGALFENPAALQFSKQFSASGFNTTLGNEFNIYNGALSVKHKYTTHALGFIHGGVNSIYRTEKTNDSILFKTGEFAYEDLMIKYAIQRTFRERLSGALSLTRYSKSIDTYSGAGYGLDAGFFYSQSRTKKYSLLIKNLVNKSVTYSDGLPKETLAHEIILGHQRDVWIFDTYSQMRWTVPKMPLFSAGIRYRLPLISLFSFSAGAKQFRVLNTVKTGMTLGASLDLLGLELNYAYEKSDYVVEPYKYYFSLSVSFDVVKQMGIKKRRVKRGRL